MSVGQRPSAQGNREAAPGRPLPYRVAPDSRARLFCVPHAGAGASAFLPWRRQLPPWLDLCSLQRSGRESRMDERPETAVGPVVEDIRAAISPFLDRPFVLFGHSVGALIAFELTRLLRRAGLPLPRRLVVSGRAAPQVRSERRPLHGLSDVALTEALRLMGGLPALMLAEPRLLRPFLPALRADCEINERYRCRPESPLDVPVTAICATSDDRARASEMRPWAAQTCGRFELVTVTGGHFALFEDPGPVLRSAVEALKDCSLAHGAALEDVR